MEPTNKSTYKKQSMTAEFSNSCLGKLIILAAIVIILLIVALITAPSDVEMKTQMQDNIRECLQDNDVKRCDPVDEVFNNIRRPFTEADTTYNDKEKLETFYRNNKLEIYNHTLFSTARVSNNLNPEGLREGIGIFGIVIPFLNYDDFLMTEGNVRGKNNDHIIKDAGVPEEMDYGDNPMLKPYHYKGNPDD
jgi:hypothetical protein